ncbi:MAG: hypothetical protein NDJ89_12920 [Oligoflexia bacterium]|nr:hypothetical protein [Oligoflexia bacterium]
MPDRSLISLLHNNPELLVHMRAALETLDFDVADFALHDELARLEPELARFLEERPPALLVCDIAHPFAENWEAFCRLRERAGLRERPFLITTPDKDALTLEAGTVPYMEIRGELFDAPLFARAVREVLLAQGRPQLLRHSRARLSGNPKLNVKVG